MAGPEENPTSQSSDRCWVSTPEGFRKQTEFTTLQFQLEELRQSNFTTEELAPKLQALNDLVTSDMASKENTLGPDHPDVLAVTHTLGLVQDEQGLDIEAEQTWRRMLQLQHTKLSDPLAMASWSVRSNLVLSLVKQRKHGEAEENARLLLPAMRRGMGEDSPQSLGLLRQLIETVSQQGRDKEAMELKAEGCELIRRMDAGKWAQYKQEELDAMADVAAKIDQRASMPRSVAVN